MAGPAVRQPCPACLENDAGNAGAIMEATTLTERTQGTHVWPRVLLLGTSYCLVEVFAGLMLHPESFSSLGFGFLWGWLLTAICLALPRLGGRIFYGITYYFITIWTMAQTGYDQLFQKLMWLSDVFYTGEGADYFSMVLTGFSPLWWIGGVFLLGLGGLVIWLMPRWQKDGQTYLACGVTVALTVAGLFLLPKVVFLRDFSVWGARSDYAQSSSSRATYTTMYDARKAYDLCGVYHLTARDLWKHGLYPLTPGYRQAKAENEKVVDQFMDSLPEPERNEMTGLFAGKNVIVVLMESMDDWLINETDTPTLCRLMAEGINFTNFYTPGYGSARTFNTEFCLNTGVYLPTDGSLAFDYITNHYRQSLANQLSGYSAQVFHYNTPDFYSRDVFALAMGYQGYNSYSAYTEDEVYDDCFVFDQPDLAAEFFRPGLSLNFLITRSAHLSYDYDEPLSQYALAQYPQYRENYPHQEEACIRAKARLVDDMFARLLAELEDRGQLDNTVIVGVTDHYAYGFQDVETMMSLSGVDDELLLEKTPCFIWSAGGPDMEVEKTLNTADLLPTLLNLLGVDSPYRYLGRDAFDPRYPGYALFPDGSWIYDGIVCRPDGTGEMEIVANAKARVLPQEELAEITSLALQYVQVSNLLLATDYYR